MNEKSKGEKVLPSLLTIDCQSVNKVQFTNEETGIVGGKNVNAATELIAKERY